MPGDKEVASRTPFTGSSGYFLEQSLREVGMYREQCFVTNVIRQKSPTGDLDYFFPEKARDRTPEHRLISERWVHPAAVFGKQLLEQEIDLVKPHVIVAFGNAALWALTGLWGIRKWRSSILEGNFAGHNCKIIPVIHPSAVQREYSLKGVFLHDLRRVKTELKRGPILVKPDWKFTIRPTYEQALSTLDFLLAQLDAASPEKRYRIASDIETRAGHTSCVCFAWSATEAISIPWMCLERLDGYWTLEQEVELIWKIQLIYRHPNAEMIWQNGAYDHQYEARWHFVVPTLGWDTMLVQHAMFSISPKSLDYLSSIYCDYHRYWKDDGRNWDPATMPEDKHWVYNAEDGVRTYEIREREQEVVDHLVSTGWTRLPEIIQFQHDIQPVFVKMMLRGVRSDDKTRAQMASALITRMEEIQGEINDIAGQELNIRSPKQMVEFFYHTLGQTPIYARLPNGARGNLTCDDDALATIASRQPVLLPLIARVQAMRSAGVFLGTFVQMPRDIDGRLRCSYNVAGTKTYRLSSSENAFGSGGNLQNIPSGDDEDRPSLIPLPNIRSLFLFDPGRRGFDLDGDSADLRIVTGESGCRAMQAYFAAKVKPYVEIAREFYRDPTITKHHHSYKYMKALCHGSNYGGTGPGLSARIGLPVHDVERMQRWYFGMCPEIKAWQDDIIAQGQGRGWIENPFGYRLYNWDRWSRKVANEFLAWTPQSSVGILINKIALAIDRQLPEVELLLQVHDSLNGQYPRHLGGEMRRKILTVAESIPVPCKSGTIYIPAGIKESDVSWGACE